MSARHQDPGAGQGERPAGWLTELLATEAERYTPDSRRIQAAMRARTDGRQRGRRRVLVPPMRPGAITAGIAAAVLCAIVAVVVAASVGTRQPPAGSSPAAAVGGLPSAGRNTEAGSPAQANGYGTQSSAGSPAIPASTAPTGYQPPPSSAAPGTRGPGPQLVSAAGTVDPGSIAYWSQEDVAVTLAEPVSAFQLTVKVARSAGVASTGYWTTYDPSVLDVTVVTQSAAVTYTFSLKLGHILPAGSARFAVQFNHGSSHNPADDTYSVRVTSDAAHGVTRTTSPRAF